MEIKKKWPCSEKPLIARYAAKRFFFIFIYFYYSTVEINFVEPSSTLPLTDFFCGIFGSRIFFRSILSPEIFPDGIFAGLFAIFGAEPSRGLAEPSPSQARAESEPSRARAEPSRAEPEPSRARAEPSRARGRAEPRPRPSPSRAEPSRAEPSRARGRAGLKAQARAHPCSVELKKNRLNFYKPIIRSHILPTNVFLQFFHISEKKNYTKFQTSCPRGRETNNELYQTIQ